MIENYSKAHYARFGDLDDVYIFSVPETLPAIPFFDIRPHTHEGLNRDDAIQQKVDQFHMVMNMIDDNYDAAYVANTVLGALIKSQFDIEHGSDSYTLNDLYDTAMRFYADRKVPRVSHQPQVANIFQNQLNKSEQEFKNTMQAVLNRLDDLQEDINLYRLFNQNPEWDKDVGTYKFNTESEQDDDDTAEDSESEPDADGAAKSTSESETADQDTAENDTADAGADDDTDEPTRINFDSVPSSVGDDSKPRSALDFRTFLDEDCIILFDSGSFVRDESQQAFSMYVLSALWGSIRAQYKSQGSHESIDKTTKIVIEEASPIVSTELVTNTLIPEAREFGLSLGMIMQYPSQVNNIGVEGSFGELRNNVETKIYGHLDPSHEVADSLVHDEQDTQAIKNKIRRLGGGEWVADLPAPKFGVEIPPPFSLTSLEIPDGHPESDRPLTDDGREQFIEDFGDRKTMTRNKHGVRRPDAEELAEQNAIGSSAGFSDNTEDSGDGDQSEAEPDPEPEPDASDDSPESKPAQPQTNVDTGDSEAGFEEDEIGQSLDAEEADRGQPSQAARSSSDSPDDSPGQEETQESPAPSLSDVEPLPRDELEARVDQPDYEGIDGLTEIAFALRDQLDEDTYRRAAVTLAELGTEHGVSITAQQLIDVGEQGEHSESAGTTDGEIDVGDVAAPDGSNTPNAQEMATDTDDSPAREEPPESPANGAEGGVDTADGDTTDDTREGGGDDETALIDRDELNVSDGEVLAGVGKEPGQSDDDDSETPHPTNVELDSPLHEAHSNLTTAERHDYNLTSDDEQFMALIADAFRGTLDDYELTDSMTSLRDRAGEPDVDKLKELGYIDETFVQRRKYYSLTRSGWRIINDGVPGNKFGDHMEKIEHRIGVHLLVNQIKEDSGVRNVESYDRYNGETYDVIAYDTDGNITSIAEVETASNNKDALIDDYQKLADAPGDSIWVFPDHEVLKENWSKLESSVLDHSASEYDKHRAQNLQEHLDSHPEDGADYVKVYSQL